MRAFAFLPSKRRVAGVIAFALMVLSAFTAVHHHRLAVAAHETAFAIPADSETSRTSDCFVCRSLVSSRELVPRMAAPHVVAAQPFDTAECAPPLAETFQPSAPRAPPAA